MAKLDAFNTQHADVPPAVAGAPLTSTGIDVGSDTNGGIDPQLHLPSPPVPGQQQQPMAPPLGSTDTAVPAVPTATATSTENSVPAHGDTAKSAAAATAMETPPESAQDRAGGVPSRITMSGISNGVSMLPAGGSAAGAVMATSRGGARKRRAAAAAAAAAAAQRIAEKSSGNSTPAAVVAKPSSVAAAVAGDTVAAGTPAKKKNAPGTGRGHRRRSAAREARRILQKEAAQAREDNARAVEAAAKAEVAAAGGGEDAATGFVAGVGVGGVKVEEGPAEDVCEEDDEGNVEYKLKLVDPPLDRLEHLVTQVFGGCCGESANFSGACVR